MLTHRRQDRQRLRRRRSPVGTHRLRRNRAAAQMNLEGTAEVGPPLAPL